jgi:hypothetical protein
MTRTRFDVGRALRRSSELTLLRMQKGRNLRESLGEARLRLSEYDGNLHYRIRG